MKSIQHMHISPPSFRLASIAIIAMTTASQAALIVNESFNNYNTGSLTDQNASGLGLSGTWSQSGPGGTGLDLQHQASGLSMSGVYSSGGSVFQSGTGNNSRTALAAFGTALPTGQLFGSYLFTTTTHSPDSRSLSMVFVGPSGSNDGTSAPGQGGFTWAANTFNGLSSAAGFEGPGVVAGGSGWVNPGISLTSSETYLMLFQFNATTGSTTAWVLNQAQLDYYLILGLETFDLNNATVGTAADQVVWTDTATAADGVIGSLSHLKLVGLPRNSSAATFEWDEFRISDTSLFEAVTVPEPSSLAFGLATGLLALRRRRRA